jgi:hypothetical protein
MESASFNIVSGDQKQGEMRRAEDFEMWEGWERNMGGRAKGDKGMKRIKERKISGQE